MDLVFLEKNLAQTQICTVDGNIYYSIVTRKPADKLVPTTRIDAHKRILPLQRVSHQEFRRLPGKSKYPEELATIEWKGIVTQARFHCHALKNGEDGSGVSASSLMRRRHALPFGKEPVFGSEKDQSFVGNDGVRYRWRCQSGGCILYTHHGNKEVARCGPRYLNAGYFNDQTRWTLHITHPDELTLDMGMLLMTFMWMDHPRLVKEIGSEWCPLYREAEPTDGDHEKTVYDEQRMLAMAAKDINATSELE
ncbi:hypothetical protein NMY22_g19323 [Coprinellus aureogranulatus]|nr:hypothetical protein NMY22_g19323 [Coprinellus aureogranulatus]